MADSDGALLQACRSGDRGAWEKLVSRYERLLYSIPIRCGLSEEDAADVFQTVCIRLLENLDRLKDQQHLTGWIILTAKRESWRVFRQQGRTTSLDPTGDTPEAASDPLPHEAVMRLEEEQLVRNGMEELGERCRQLLGWLYHFDPPLSYVEIGQRMNVSTGAIGPTRARCLQQLKRILQRMGF